MGLPRINKNFNLFVDGESFLGVIAELEEPKLALATEDIRSGGMLGPVKADMGLEGLECSLTMAGHTASLIRKFGTTRVDGVRLRAVQAYQSDDGRSAQSVNIIMGGRFAEIDLGKSKAGDATEHKFTVPLAYYRREVNGRIEVEIDMVRGIYLVDGVDRYAEIMAIITS